MDRRGVLAVEIGDIFKKHYKNGAVDYERLICDLRDIKGVLMEFHGICALDEDDNRSGEETYGFDGWKNQLDYISYKWGCQFRIRWILDLLNKEK